MGNVFNSRKRKCHYINNKNNKRVNFKPLALAIAVAITGTLPNIAKASTPYTVTSTADSGAGSLREAIGFANAANYGDTIIFDPTLVPPGSTIKLDSELNITDSLTIRGPTEGDPASIIIDGQDQFRHINGSSFISGGGKRIKLENITLRNGKYEGTSNSADFGGGSIFVKNADLFLEDSIITNNQTSGTVDIGGGIAVLEGDLTISRSTISNNKTLGRYANGGGIFVSTGDIYLDHSTVSGNATEGLASDGGGMFIEDTSDTTIFNSTISNNSTIGKYAEGGGFSIEDGDLLTVSQTTISGNQSTGEFGRGGGIFLLNTKADVIQSTIYDNTTSTDGAGVSANISVDDPFTLRNSILSGNTNTVTGNGNFHDRAESTGAFVTATHSFFGDVGTEITDQTNSIMNIVDDNNPNLGPLLNNGGLTYTHLPNVGSLVINKGENFSVSPVNDQRGSGFLRTFNGTVDIGAVEFQNIEIPFSFDIDGNGEDAALSDGLLVLRYLFGFTGDALIDNAIGSSASRTKASEIQTYIQQGVTNGDLDIDANGEVTALTDSLLLLRHQFGFSGDSLIQNAIGDNATRNTAVAIENFLD